MSTAAEVAPVDWLQTMSASKIAAVVGLSPYDSRFSLWHRMAGLVPAQEDSPALRRGHYLEPAILAWFRDQHPDWEVAAAHESTPDYWTTLPDGRDHPVWQCASEPRFTASPDGFALLPDGERRLVEVKSASDVDEWGQAGTDEIPVGYKAQVQWQMLVTGVAVTHIAVLTPFLEFREYVVEADAEDHAVLASAAREFLDSLPGGPAEQRPDLDAHASTYEAVKRLHPEIDRARDIELDAVIAKEFCEARAALVRAEDRARLATSTVTDLMGDARRALFLGKTLATRQAKGEGIPYLVAGRSLPTFDDQPQGEAA